MAPCRHVRRRRRRGRAWAKRSGCTSFPRVVSVPASSWGLIATNSIGQGTTREVALDPIAPIGSRRIFRAVSSRAWPGQAGVTIAMVWWQRKHPWECQVILDEVPVDEIETDLYPSGRVRGFPSRLPCHAGAAGMGQNVLGMGFTLRPEEARKLIASDPRNAEALDCFYNGEWVSASPSKRIRMERWIINFRQWPIEKAMEYPELFEIVERKVKTSRQRLTNPQFRNLWWQFANTRKALRARMDGQSHVIGATGVSNKVSCSNRN